MFGVVFPVRGLWLWVADCEGGECGEGCGGEGEEGEESVWWVAGLNVGGGGTVAGGFIGD